MFGSGIKTLLKTTLASTLVAAAMFGASASTANAGSLDVAIGLGGPGGISIQSVGYGGHKKKWDRQDRHGRRGGYGGHGRHGSYGGGRSHRNKGCSPRRAVRKAWNMGLNHPHVKRVGRRHIVVKGGYHGSRAKIVFSRYGRCQVVNFERNHW